MKNFFILIYLIISIVYLESQFSIVFCTIKWILIYIININALFTRYIS